MKFNILSLVNRLNNIRFFFRSLSYPDKVKSKIVLNHAFGDKGYNRIAAINFIINNSFIPVINYLEIGCNDNSTFDSIPLINKVGVDPNIGGNVRLTSDEFFSNNETFFSLIFIDGFHTYEQVKSDAINSAKSLSSGGTILMHDFLPSSWKSAVPNSSLQLSSGWNGDCYKFAFELLNKNLDFEILNIDEGILVLRNDVTINFIASMESVVDEEFNDITFNYYLENYQKLPIIEFDDLMRKYRSVDNK